MLCFSFYLHEDGFELGTAWIELHPNDFGLANRAYGEKADVRNGSKGEILAASK